MTRSRSAEAGSTPPSASLVALSSLPTHSVDHPSASWATSVDDSDEEEERDDSGGGVDGDAKVASMVTPAGIPFNEDHLLSEEEVLDAELEQQRLAELVSRVEAKRKAVAEGRESLAALAAAAAAPTPSQLRAMRPAPRASMGFGEPDRSGHAAAAALVQTPARYPSQRALLELQATVNKKTPSARSLLHQAYLDNLPLLGSSQRMDISSAPLSRGSASRMPKTATPTKFTGDNPSQNETIQRWVETVNAWLGVQNIPVSHHLVYARGFIESHGSASTWLLAKDAEVLGAGREMTWEWLQMQLVSHFSQQSGIPAMQAEWEGLRMGEKNADGTETGGKATRTVNNYTSRFLSLMRQLTPHDVRTTDMLVIAHYVSGIREGYEALYRAMKGTELVLRFSTLAEAIERAELAEIDLNISKKERARSSSSTSSSSGGQSTAGGRYNNRGGRGTTAKGGSQATVNNTQGEDRSEGESESQQSVKAKSHSASANTTQVYGFVFRPDSSHGRHVLTEAEQRMLYQERRCYRCYKVHPVGRDTPRCEVVKKEAPKLLNLAARHRYHR